MWWILGVKSHVRFSSEKQKARIGHLKVIPFSTTRDKCFTWNDMWNLLCMAPAYHAFALFCITKLLGLDSV